MTCSAARATSERATRRAPVRGFSPPLAVAVAMPASVEGGFFERRVVAPLIVGMREMTSRLDARASPPESRAAARPCWRPRITHGRSL